MSTVIRMLSNGLRRFNQWMAILSALMIVTATVVLVYEVVTRYYLQIANDWVIEFCIYLLIAATFMSAAYTQAERGHVGIEVLDEVLSPRSNRVRLLFGDILSVIVVAFVARNAWHFGWTSYEQGWTTSSTWAPPLWIPYFFMAFGLTMTGLQIILQILEALGLAVPYKETKRTEVAHAQNLTGA